MNFSALENPQALSLEKRDYHVPVMGQEVLSLLRPAPGMVLYDGTLGGAGHTGMLLRHGSTVIATDRDTAALDHAYGLLEAYPGRLSLWHDSFDEVDRVLDAAGVRSIAGAILDLGVSSHQFDTAERGFSLKQDGPLDMRMDPTQPTTAREIIERSSVGELARIFLDYGEEPRAFQVATRIVEARGKREIATTFQLLEVIEPALPSYSPKHPATRVFQALRMAVNEELDALERALKAITNRIASGGRFVVISFHSLEDRMVKRFFREHSREWLDRPEWPAPRRNPDYSFRILTPKPIEATQEEVDQNPRSRSAKLRAVERL